MIKYTPYPILFSIDSFHVYTFSLFLSAGMLTSYLYARREVIRSGLDPDFFTSLTVYTLIGTFLGAKIYSFAQPTNFTPEFFTKALLFHKEGSSIGGFLGAMIVSSCYTSIKKVYYWHYADTIAPAVLLGIAIVRIGCFLNWDDYGTQCTLFWGIFVDDYPRHPTQIYESLFCLTLFFLLSYYKKRKSYHGCLFLLMVFGYSSGRFFIEFMRDSSRYWIGLTITQIMILFVVTGIFITLFCKNHFFQRALK